MICLGIAAAAVAFAFPRFAQDPQYHDFADRRCIAGVPNLLNVVSNAVFAVAGILGLRLAWKHARLPAAATFFFSAVLIAAGSAYYHVRPTNQTLVWDRLPMTVAFMSLLALAIGDRIGMRAGRLLLVPLIGVGIGSVIYWRLREAAGRGDLRFYALVQFFPMLAIPLMLLWFPGRYFGTAGFCCVLGWYVAAKVCELLDRQIFSLGGIVSGHTLKHLAAGMAVFWVWRTLRRRTVIQPVL
jgi:hypothetical protein